jgi:catechol 2,3-dioxygenase-like lactoylglutathione lyase family enzyme
MLYSRGERVNAILQGVHPVLATNDIAASVQFYRRLGFGLSSQDHPAEPTYVVVRRDTVELHIQWAGIDQWAPAVDRPVYRFIVSDVDTIYAEFVSSGAVDAASGPGGPWAAPADTPWGTREFHLRDPGHNGLQFYRPL